MKRFVLFLLASLAFLQSGCATGELVRGGVREGMSKPQVITELGNPDGFQRSGDYEALLYTNRLIIPLSFQDGINPRPVRETFHARFI
jgi:hypothetical protein